MHQVTQHESVTPGFFSAPDLSLLRIMSWLDADGDGEISSDELATLDVDGDGKISKVS